MNFFTVDTNDDRLLLVAQGEIKEGDDRRLHEFVAKLPAQTKLFAIGLDSPGGDLREGVYLANSIHSTGLPTIVSSRGMCASACFLMFAAGSTRMASINARIGVHSASADGEDNGPAQAVTTLMARQAAEFGVPPSIIGKMVTTPPDDMTWLNRQDLAAMNTTILPSFESTYTPGSELVPGSAVQTTGPAWTDQSTHADAAPEHDPAYMDGETTVSLSSSGSESCKAATRTAHTGGLQTGAGPARPASRHRALPTRTSTAGARKPPVGWCSSTAAVWLSRTTDSAGTVFDKTRGGWAWSAGFSPRRR